MIFFWGGRVGGRSVGRVRVVVNEKLKFLRKLKKNRGGGSGGCSGWGGQGRCE